MSSTQKNTPEKINTRTRILQETWKLMEEHRGQSVNMRDIAKAVGISRQALYLHFPSKTELMIATSHYVDEEKGLEERLMQLQTAANGIELLEAGVEVWGNYIPEIYGLAKTLLSIRDTDEAAAAAWNENMGYLRLTCQEIIQRLFHEGILAAAWAQEEAVEMLWTMLSIYNWEQLTVECGWSTEQYVQGMKTLLRHTFIDENNTK